MASERDFELLDDYLRNKLSDADRSMFEGRMQADPELQREFKLQQGIVESLRKARVAELKAMLSDIPTSAIPNTTSTLAKWSGLAISLLVGVGLYFYMKPEPPVEVPAETESVNVISGHDQAPSDVTSAQPSSDQDEPSRDNISSKENTPARKNQPLQGAPMEKKPSEIDVFDPTSESIEESEAPEVVTSETSTTSPKRSDITSEIVTDHKTYKFHYQFRDDRLVLYGSFDNNLYSIMEFISENKRTVFLEYKNNFYLLNQAGEKIKPLSPVNDPALIQKLRER